jgi:Kef-type K+ transport system membrane component KefB
MSLDARAELVRGARALALTLLAWLLPMMTAFAVAFLLALPFTGLQPLWSTRYATGTLLAASGALVFLINAAYQDGQAGDAIARPVQYARSIAALGLVPLVALAVYGLMLRAQQYGWTAALPCRRRRKVSGGLD